MEFNRNVVSCGSYARAINTCNNKGWNSRDCGNNLMVGAVTTVTIKWNILVIGSVFDLMTKDVNEGYDNLNSYEREKFVPYADQKNRMFN